MHIKNTTHHYGLIAILLHWVLAIVFIGLFVLGFWMVGLDYYSTWYHDAPAIHKSIGVLAVSLMLLRFFWKLSNPQPNGLDKPLLNTLAHVVHGLFYLLILLLGLSGYLISTAEGDSIFVFDWFELPALLTPFEGQADLAGLIHEWVAYVFIGTVVLHALAALKHHFIDRNETLKRMLNPMSSK